MQNIKESFILPKKSNIKPKAMISHKESDNMMLYSLMNVLQEQKKRECLEFITNFSRIKSFEGIQSEDVLREIRSGRAQEIMTHSST